MPKNFIEKKPLKSALKTPKAVDAEKKSVSFSDPLEVAGAAPNVDRIKRSQLPDNGFKIVGVGISGGYMGGLVSGERGDKANPLGKRQILPDSFRDAAKNKAPARVVAPRYVARFGDRGVGAINPVTWQYAVPLGSVVHSKAPSTVIAKGVVARSLDEARSINYGRI